MINFLNSIREHILNKFRKVQVTQKLNPNSLIVQCDQHKGNKFIYSLKDKRMVGNQLSGKQGDKYIAHNI